MRDNTSRCCENRKCLSCMTSLHALHFTAHCCRYPYSTASCRAWSRFFTAVWQCLKNSLVVWIQANMVVWLSLYLVVFILGHIILFFQMQISLQNVTLWFLWYNPDQIQCSYILTRSRRRNGLEIHLFPSPRRQGLCSGCCWHVHWSLLCLLDRWSL